MSETALLIIDWQNDYFPSFEGAKCALPNAENAILKAGELLSAFREKGLSVVHVQHIFPTEESSFFVPGTDGTHIHETVTPKEGEPLIVKQFANSFRDTNLKEVLDEIGVKNLVIAGAMSNMCIDAGTRAAADLGYSVSVAEDACAALPTEFNGVEVPADQVHAAYMANLGMGYAEIKSTDVIVSSL
ncbi:cysteine hydrolase family protein [Curvivirga sp.]|uniref:cysteine hydrolase family protein n=1 Tax=Curvivirga sp. TaxID=2856848 RepID=UPI003B5A37E8